MNCIKLTLLSFFFFFIITTSSYSFDDKTTHRDINEVSVSPIYSEFDYALKQKINFSKGIDEELTGRNGNNRISEWVMQGGTDEDSGIRAFNHFHDPTKPWLNAGLFELKNSSLIWAQNSEKNDASWQIARNKYYEALTTNSQDAYVTTFKTLGQLMHLVSDNGVPAHVRDDAHPEVILGLSHFETWAKKLKVTSPSFQEIKIGKSIFSHAKLSSDAKIPISALWDIDKYNKWDMNPEVTLEPIIGFAEFTNANFFSEGTISTDEYPYPINAVNNMVERTTRLIPDPFQPGATVNRPYWLKKAAGGLDSYLLAGVGYFYFENEYYAPNGEVQRDFAALSPMDGYVYQDYANLLIPRAIGYSASLLDYFFRGKIEIQGPSITTGAKSSISFSVKNNTPPIEKDQAVEPFSSGTLTLIYSYLTTSETDGKEMQHFESRGIVYTVTGATDPINSELQQISVNLPVAIPADAYDISFTLVFRGKLGNEEDAVAAQVSKFNSRIAYNYQPGGQPNTSNIFTISPDGSYPLQVTPATTPNPWFFTPAWSRDGSKMALEVERCNDPNYPNDSFCSEQYYSRKIAVIDLLSEQQYPNNKLYELDYNGIPVCNASFSPDGTQLAAILTNFDTLYLYSNIVVIDTNSDSRWIVNDYDDPLYTVLRDRPAWSPTDNRIAYVLNGYYDNAGGKWQWVNDIFLVNADGSGKMRLTDDNFIDIQPSWSPDGKWLVFSSDRDGEESMDIWVMDSNGDNLRKVCDCTPASCYTPVFSPDGKYIAFGNGSSIYTIKSNGDRSSLKEIANPGLLAGSLAWSPYLTPPSIEAQAQPFTILAGASATLNWQSNGAEEVHIGGIDRKQPANGSITVSPAETTTYTITAVGISGAADTTVTVIVQ